MSPFRTSVQSFLQTAKTTLSSSANTTPLTIIVGNQSADLDSILSAVVLAYILQSSSISKSAHHRAYIPLTNLGPSDLLLRTELVPVLSRASLKPSDLLTIDDLPKSFGERHTEGSTRWILVDHNKLELPFSNPKWNVSRDHIVGCIDHHKDENYVRPQRTTKEEDGVDMRVIEKSGSCMSHIINYARETGNWKDTGPLDHELYRSSEIGPSDLELEAQTAVIALAPILIDTANLTDPYKTTEIDLEIVQFLEGKIVAWETSQNEQGRGENAYERNTYFKEIDTAKQNLEPLTLQQIWRKDYKEWEDESGRRIGTSAVVKPLEWMLEKAGRSKSDNGNPKSKEECLKVFSDELSEFVASRVDAEKRGLDVFCIMNAFTDENSGSFRRQLLVAPTSKVGEHATSSFEESHKEKFGLEPKSGWEINKGASLGDGVRVWEQGNLNASRKETAPALREVLSSVEK